MSGDGGVGKINQALYFARLHCDHARALQNDSQGEPPFLRQQQLCFLEAAVECLYRGLFFLTLRLLDSRVNSHLDAKSLSQQLQAAPEQLLGIVKTASQQSPAPELATLLHSLQNPAELALLIDARSNLWNASKAASAGASAATSSVSIQLVDISLSLESCEQWLQLLADINQQIQASIAEY